MIKLNNFYIGESVSFIRKNIPDDFVDLTVTSPPYDDLRIYKGFVFDYQNMLKELYRVTKQGGVVVWVVNDKTYKGSETLTSFKQALFAKEKIGFNVETMIYNRTSPFPANIRYQQDFEYMFVFSKGKVKTFNPLRELKSEKEIKKITKRKIDPKTKSYRNKDGSTKKLDENGLKRVEKASKDITKIKSNVWRINAGYMVSTVDKIAFNHPAIFPDKLAEDHIISWSNEGDIVLDPMCGAGTTCKMAWLNNRKFIGIDMSEEYINEICIPRLEMYGWKQEENKNTNINILTN